MLPIEVDVPTHRRISYDLEQNNELLSTSLDFLDEKRNEAELRMAAYQRRVACYYNSRVRPVQFKEGDLVLRKIFPKGGALDPKWEDPYIIKKNLGTGAYHIMNEEGEVYKHSWNAEHLRPYFTRC